MRVPRPTALLILLALFGSAALSAQSLYKYQDESGEWVYSDRPPPDGSRAEVRSLDSSPGRGFFDLRAVDGPEAVRFVATNTFHIPVQVRLDLTRIEGLAFPDPDMGMTWVIPARSQANLFALEKLGLGPAPRAEFDYEYVAGDPAASHRPAQPYRAPFAISSDFPVTQAYPDIVTHGTPDSYHAVDIEMPVGTDIFAARGGVVFDVSGDNYTSGLDPARDGPTANVVQILHDDGTYALYAHLNWNSIRVRPGDRVERGEYIADSGNTGYSSGPHLHFAVLVNAGLQTRSVPVTFSGADRTPVEPTSGAQLTAY